MLKVDALYKRYGELEVVHGVSFHVLAGHCFGLLGPNGAGKTTTLRCCLGLIAPDKGSITLAELPVPSEALKARLRRRCTSKQRRAPRWRVGRLRSNWFRRVQSTHSQTASQVTT